MSTLAHRLHDHRHTAAFDRYTRRNPPPMTSETPSTVQPPTESVTAHDLRLTRAQALTTMLHERCDPDGRTLRVLTIMLTLVCLIAVVCVPLDAAEPELAMWEMF